VLLALSIAAFISESSVSTDTTWSSAKLICTEHSRLKPRMIDLAIEWDAILISVIRLAFFHRQTAIASPSVGFLAAESASI
jgi:hypothetical protein